MQKTTWDSGKKSVAEISDQQVRPQGIVKDNTDSTN